MYHKIEKLHRRYLLVFVANKTNIKWIFFTQKFDLLSILFFCTHLTIKHWIKKCTKRISKIFTIPQKIFTMAYKKCTTEDNSIQEYVKCLILTMKVKSVSLIDRDFFTCFFRTLILHIFDSITFDCFINFHYYRSQKVLVVYHKSMHIFILPYKKVSSCRSFFRLILNNSMILHIYDTIAFKLCPGFWNLVVLNIEKVYHKTVM